MYKKKCPNCGKYSYSASLKGKWTCPHCKKDISNVKAVTDDKKPGDK